jgi:hypothetical protein
LTHRIEKLPDILVYRQLASLRMNHSIRLAVRLSSAADDVEDVVAQGILVDQQQYGELTDRPDQTCPEVLG